MMFKSSSKSRKSWYGLIWQIPVDLDAMVVLREGTHIPVQGFSPDHIGAIYVCYLLDLKLLSHRFIF